ncbi:MAG: hypothetical protein ACRDUY_03645, partial [Nitriliruptorales bacterium]
MRAVPAALIAFSLLLAACGGDDPTIADPGEPDLVATLGGDPHLEGGCVWLDRVPGEPAPGEADRYTPTWPAGYTAEFDPIRLVGPDGEVVAEEGDTLRVEGAVDENRVTTCMTGPVFVVERILGTNGDQGGSGGSS